MMRYTCVQALQIVSLNVSTACHYNICVAVRISEALQVINDSSFSALSLESALKHSGIGKRSKQRFLKTNLRDDTIRKRSRGAGGNTNTFKCKQSAVPDETIELLAKGMCMHAS